MHYQYRTANTCSKVIDFDLENNIVTNVQFLGGCPGNLKALSILVDGMTVEQIVAKLQGVTCGPKSTSCSDQLTRAVLAAQKDAQANAGKVIG